MHSKKTIAAILAGVSAVAMTAALTPAFASGGTTFGPGGSSTVVTSVDTDPNERDYLWIDGYDVDGSLLNDVDLGGGPAVENRYGINVFNGSIIEGSLVNDAAAMVTANISDPTVSDTNSGPGITAVGIYVDDGAQVGDAVVNEGFVGASASAHRGLAYDDAFAFGISVLGDRTPDLRNGPEEGDIAISSEAAVVGVFATASASGYDSALAIAGGLGEITLGEDAQGSIDNNGHVGVKAITDANNAEASLYNRGAAEAIALGYGAGQLMAGGQEHGATADLVNGMGGSFDVYVSAAATDYGTAVGVGAGVGLIQGVLSGDDAEGYIRNDGTVMVTALGNGHSIKKNNDPLRGVGAGASVGAGSIQIVLGAHDAVATADNYSDIDVVSRGEGTSDDGLGIGVAVGVGGLQLAGSVGDADAITRNYKSIDVDVDAYATGSSAVAVGVAAGEAQVAVSLQGEATAYVNNVGSIEVDSYAESSGFAVALGLGALQAAISDDEANATFSNNGTIHVDSLSKGQAFGMLPSAIGMGAAQIALSYDDGAGVKFTNSNRVDLHAQSESADDIAYANAMGLGGSLQVAGSFWDLAIAELTNVKGGVIDVHADASAYAEAYAAANAYVIGAAQIGLSGDDDAVGNVVNHGDISAHASSLAMHELDAAPADVVPVELDAIADADAAGLDQAMISGGGRAIAYVENFDLIKGVADAYASGSGTTVSAIAGAQGINQYGFAAFAGLTVINSGDISGTAYATAHGDGATAAADADGLVQSGLSLATTAKLDNSGTVTAEAISKSDDMAVANATGHRVEAPSPALDVLMGINQLNAPQALPGPGDLLDIALLANQTYLLDPYRSVGILSPLLQQLPANIGSGELLNRVQTLDLPASGGAFVPQGAMPQAMALMLNVDNHADGEISGYAEATGKLVASAQAAGAWYQAGGELAPGYMDGTIVNAGLISGHAVANATELLGQNEQLLPEQAQAFGVMQVAAGDIDTELTNTGTIEAEAEAAWAAATAIAIGSLGPFNDQDYSDEESKAVVTNSGGLIWAGVKQDDGTEGGSPIQRGNAINTRGLSEPQMGSTHVGSGAIYAAANAVEVNLEGGLAGHGKEHALKQISNELKDEFGGETSMGFVYGDIQLNFEDVINVVDGVTLFDGVINKPEVVGYTAGGEFDSTLNINNHGTLVMLQNETDGASRGYVNRLHIGNNGETGSDRVETDGTLVYELTRDHENDGENGTYAYSQIFADTADIGNAQFRAVFRAGHYDDVTVYQDIIDAGELFGAFDSVSDNSLLLDTQAVYDDAHNVDLVVERTAFNAVGGLTHNQQSVAGGIEKVYPDNMPDGPFSDLVASMFTIGSEAAYADFLNQLSGAEYAQQLQSVLWSTRGLNRVITERMECTDGSVGGTQLSSAKVGDNTVMPTADAPMASTGCFEPGQASVWMRGTGQWTSLDGNDEAPGLDETQYGILFGADYSFDENWFAGIAGGYFNSNGDFEDWGGRSGGSSEYDGLQLAAYGGYDNSTYYLRGVLAYGNYDGSVDRSIDTHGLAGSGTHGNLSGDPSSDVFSFYGETGYRFAIADSANITPFAGLSLASATLDGFTEDDSNNTGAALDVEDSNADSVASVLGLRLEADIAMGSGVFTPSVSVAWMHEFGDTTQTVDASFAAAPGTDFSVEGSEVARDSVVVDAGMNFAMDNAIDLGVFYSGQFNEDYSANAVSARLGYKF